MIIECRKGKKAFSRLIFQPLQKAKNCFFLLYHCNRNRQISFRNLLANQRFAVEILEFRLSIVVITQNVKSHFLQKKFTDDLTDVKMCAIILPWKIKFSKNNSKWGIE